MNKIMFNERYGLQSAVFEGRKTQTRREPFYYNNDIDWFTENGKIIVVDEKTREIIHKSRYAAGEIVAVAQSYSAIFDEADNDYFNDIYSNFRNAYVTESKGWKNKMFVRDDLMTHHIKILDIRCERLQDISESDCIKEGVQCYSTNSFVIWDYEKSKCFRFYTAKECFLYLLNLVSKKEHRTINPYVIVYEFELVD